MNEEMKEKIEELTGGKTLGDIMTGSIRIESINKDSKELLEEVEEGFDFTIEERNLNNREFEEEIFEKIVTQESSHIEEITIAYNVFGMIVERLLITSVIEGGKDKEDLLEDIESIEKLIQDIIQKRTEYNEPTWEMEDE